MSSENREMKKLAQTEKAMKVFLAIVASIM